MMFPKEVLNYLRFLIFQLIGYSICFFILIFEFFHNRQVAWFVEFRKFVKKYLRTMLWPETYVRFGSNEETIRRGESYINKMIKNIIENKKDEFDHYILEEGKIEFHKNIMSWNLTGEAKLHDGFINGLTNLNQGHYSSVKEVKNKLRVQAKIIAYELEFHCKGSIKFLNSGLTLLITGSLFSMEIFMDFTVNPKTGKEGELLNFVVDEIRGMDVTVSGLGFLDSAIKSIIFRVAKKLQTPVKNIIEHQIGKHIREHISNYQFPIERDPSASKNQPSAISPVPSLEVSEESSEPESEASDEASEPESETSDEASESETELSVFNI